MDHKFWERVATIFFAFFAIRFPKGVAVNAAVPALFAFGDSILDTGNNNNLVTLTKSNYPPYGRDFEGGRPTGRFCNGKTPTDLIATALGIKESVPAYLSGNLSPQDLITGVCFASAGSGIDDRTSQIQSLYDLGVRKVWVLSTLPLGCLPGGRTLAGGPLRICAPIPNLEAQTFNGQLSSAVDSIRASLTNYDIRFIDVYTPFLNLINNPQPSGFTDVAEGCCGSGSFGSSLPCTLLSVCPNPATYIFWDLAHPTERAYQLVVLVEIVHGRSLLICICEHAPFTTKNILCPSTAKMDADIIVNNLKPAWRIFNYKYCLRMKRAFFLASWNYKEKPF
ncbi:unnamed protein product [Sphenostylis stenocarpa]|uniref:Uncharacterized protein n=1 Tax=Sphenostylis stenocarpa TaxID=92480 RepID=A0AA86TM41_9FABA|nr:unnamed protein product [Sphenostylis stenocarpa]